MARIRSKGVKTFSVFNIILLSAVALSCVVPFIHIVALSLSDNIAAMSGLVLLVPVNFTVDAYSYVLEQPAFWRAFLVTVERVFVGGGLGIFLTLLLAYPLSKQASRFRFRSAYVWFFFITMLFSGGLVPTYVLISGLGLKNSIWALVLPGAVSVYNILIMLNFYRQLPEELEEAAFMDGAGHFRTLFSIYIPCSLPAIATIALFTIVGHWNAWFDGLIYMSRAENYPLQSYLQTIVTKMDFQNMTTEELKRLNNLNQRSIISAQMIVAMVPILILYPFLQKYFVSGMTLGSVKG